MNEIVKYDNVMNQLRFRGFEQRDFDLLMALCARMRSLGTVEIELEYSYIMDLVKWDKSKSIKIFHEDLKRMNDKLLGVGASIDINDYQSVSFVLFTTFFRDLRARTLKVSVNPQYAYILNDLSKNFTRFALAEFVRIDGRYAKQLYRQIRQRYQQKGHFWQPSVTELREVLDIPDAYDTRRIYTKIIAPALPVLKSCKGLGGLEAEVLRSDRRGRAVTGYRFTWTTSEHIEGQMDFADWERAHPKGKEKAAKEAPAPKRRRGRPRKERPDAIDERKYDYKALEDRFAKN